MIDLGVIYEGEKIVMEFNFTNVGTGDLVIDLVTACKCTELNWPTEKVPPGNSGIIKVVFDSTGFEGETLKTVDIIANTDPIVVEAKFKAVVIK